MTQATANYVCVWFGTPGECQNCGGWTKAEDGPFPGDERFCSEECFVESQEFAERARRQAASDWCPSCGYDRHEHAPDCPSGSGQVPTVPATPGHPLDTDVAGGTATVDPRLFGGGK